MNIRPANAEDIKAISDLIRGVAHYFLLNPNGEGAEQFLLSITPEAIEGYITNPSFNYLVCYIDQELAGVIAIREKKHLFHLFVAPKFQRRGIALKLWQEAKEAAISSGNVDGFTVNSTPYAVPIYKRFGFSTTGPRIEKNGIAFVPMQLLLKDEIG